jgi:quercetin dioxygenase-like cupin family protein
MRTLALEKQGESLIFPAQRSHPDEAMTFEVRMAPGAIGPDTHAHPLQEETFQVVEGRFIGTIDGKELVLEAGEEVLVERGAMHTFRNGHPDRELVLKVRLEPALGFEWMMVESARSAIRNGGDWKSMPMLEMGYIMHQMPGEYRVPGMPMFILNSLVALLHTLARLTGASKRITDRQAYYAGV